MLVAENQEGQAQQAGKGGEVKDDSGGVPVACSQLPDEGVGGSGTHAAQSPGNGGNGRLVVKAGLDDAYAPREGHQHPQDLDEAGRLLQQKDGKDDGEERGELIEHIGVGQIQLSYGVEVAEQPQSAAEAPAEQRRNVSLFRAQRDSVPDHGRGHDQQGNKVPEKSLLEGGQVPCQLDKGGQQQARLCHLHRRRAAEGHRRL